MTASLQSDKWFKESLPNSANSTTKYHISLPVGVLTPESIFTYMARWSVWSVSHLKFLG